MNGETPMSEENEAHLKAAALLGQPVDEIADVEETDLGTLIKTSDGTVMIDVPADRPDQEGKTGLMLAVAPKRYSGHFPVYVGLPAPETDDEVEYADGGVIDDPGTPETVQPPAHVGLNADERVALELEAIDLGVDYDGVADEELQLAVQAAKEAVATPAEPVFDREAWLNEALTLDVKKPQKLSDDELVAAVIASRPPDATGGDGQ